MAIVYIGDASFQQSGPPQYVFGGWELDRLVTAYQGNIYDLEGFLTSIAAWTPSPYDTDMFLGDYTVDGDRVKPTVTLTYLGKRQGILTAGKHDYDDAVLSATNAAGSITVQYYAPRTALTWISREKGVLGPSGEAEDPSGIPRVISVVFAPAQLISNPALIDLILVNNFSQQIVSTIHSEELVSEQYWLNTQTKTMSLISYSTSTPDGSMHIQFQMMIRNDDVSDGFVIYLGNASSQNVCGVWHDGSTWQIHSHNGPTDYDTTIPVEFDQYTLIVLTLIPTSSGYDVRGSISGVDFTPITGLAPDEVTFIQAGAYSGTGFVKRNLANGLRVGRFFGGNDIFWALIAPVAPAVPTYVPPWQTSFGGSISVNPTDFSLDFNTGPNVHVQKQLAAPFILNIP
jgi:hypothetical protein